MKIIVILMRSNSPTMPYAAIEMCMLDSDGFSLTTLITFVSSCVSCVFCPTSKPIMAARPALAALAKNLFILKTKDETKKRNQKKNCHLYTPSLIKRQQKQLYIVSQK